MVNLLVHRRNREERLGRHVDVIFRIGASVRRGSRTGGAAGVAVLRREQVRSHAEHGTEMGVVIGHVEWRVGYVAVRGIAARGTRRGRAIGSFFSEVAAVPVVRPAARTAGGAVMGELACTLGAAAVGSPS